jgi:hypothetical protein
MTSLTSTISSGLLWNHYDIYDVYDVYGNSQGLLMKVVTVAVDVTD